MCNTRRWPGRCAADDAWSRSRRARVSCFRQSFAVPGFFTGAKMVSTSAREFFVERLGGPLRRCGCCSGFALPLTVVVMSGPQAEAGRELRNVHALARTMRGRGARGSFHGFRFLEPRGQRRVREQPRAERAGIHHADAFRLEIRDDLVGEARVLQRVLVVAQRAIDARLVEDEAEDFHRVTAEADVAHLARGLRLAQRGDRLIDDLLHRYKLDVVAENDVEMIRAEPVQRDIDRFRHALRGEVEVLQIVAAELRAELVAFARHAFQRDAEQHLAHAAAVERRGVDEVEPAIERDADALKRFVELHAAKLRTERRRAETEDWKLEVCLSEWTGLHGSAFRRRARGDALQTALAIVDCSTRILSRCEVQRDDELLPIALQHAPAFVCE